MNTVSIGVSALFLPVKEDNRPNRKGFNLLLGKEAYEYTRYPEDLENKLMWEKSIKRNFRGIYR